MIQIVENPIVIKNNEINKALEAYQIKSEKDQEDEMLSTQIDTALKDGGVENSPEANDERNDYTGGGTVEAYGSQSSVHHSSKGGNRHDEDDELPSVQMIADTPYLESTPE